MSAPFIHGLHKLVAKPQSGCVVTIGSFDGVHRGHQAVLKKVAEKASELSVPSMAIVFEPQPNEFFAKQSAPARLMRLREKVLALLEAGVDQVLCLKFDLALRSLTAQEYIEDVLHKKIGVRYLVVGDDFRFGCDRAGDFSMLEKEGKRIGFEVCDTQTFAEKDSRISSTRIRKLLESDQLDEAKSLLGRPYSIMGRVFYGKQLGQSIGFPTANLGLGRFHSPVNGVYTVEVENLTKNFSQGKTKGIARSESSQKMRGVANVGVRPTVSGDKKTVLEVHLLDTNMDAYGKCLKVSFLKKLRDEMRFDGIDMLKEQIQRDVTIAREYFQRK